MTTSYSKSNRSETLIMTRDIYYAYGSSHMRRWAKFILTLNNWIHQSEFLC
jgi:hypothetical protein